MDRLIPHSNEYQYPKLYRVDSEAGRTYRVKRFKGIPSVTTVLSKTKDTTTLDAWAARIGQAEAERIKTQAAHVGTNMHKVIECFLSGEPLTLGQDWLSLQGQQMAFSIINKYLKELSVVHGSEVGLHYTTRYAGTADLIGVYRNRLAVVDFKQSTRPKRHEYIQDYFLQLAAYAMAHDWLFGTQIDYGVVLVAVQDGTVQEFTTTGDEFLRFRSRWEERLEAFEAASQKA